MRHELSGGIDAATRSGSELESQDAFRAVLMPYRSLSRNGFFIVMAALCLVSFGAGIVFLIKGAWPVFAFLGLDVLLVYLAFKLNYRAGRQYEIVDLSREALVLTRHDPYGRVQKFDFNPSWVRVRLTEWPDGRNDLRLASHGRELSFGRFLTDDERRDFADALKGALVTAQGGPRI